MCGELGGMSDNKVRVNEREERKRKQKKFKRMREGRKSYLRGDRTARTEE